MEKVENFFGNQIKVFDEYPYDRRHSEILMFANEVIVKFSDGLFLFYLDNSILDYSIEFLRVPDKLLLPSLRYELKNPILQGFLFKDIVSESYLHLINDEEVVISGSEFSREHICTRIGVRFEFENGNEIYLYSGEAEDYDDGRYKILTESPVICMQIIDKKNGRIRLEKDDPFCPFYIDIDSVV